MSHNLLVTGFGPFGACNKNPSQALAETCGRPFRVLRVSYAATDEFVESLRESAPSKLLLMGLHSKAKKFHIENVAHNRVGAAMDMDGRVGGPGPIEPGSPSQMAATLWKHSAFFEECAEWTPTTDAGGYLCNYIFYKTLQRLPETEIGFLHVPAESLVAIDAQRRTLQNLLDLLDS